MSFLANIITTSLEIFLNNLQQNLNDEAPHDDQIIRVSAALMRFLPGSLTKVDVI